LNEFKDNLVAGIAYYRDLIPQMTEQGQAYRSKMMADLDSCQADLEELIGRYPGLFATGEPVESNGLYQQRQRLAV
jgi:hypothetical protein